MADRRRVLGSLGEDLAAGYLQRNGLLLLERGWRCSYGEIDLVMLDGSTLVFIEVRTRRGAAGGAPEESLSARKRERLARLGAAYLQQLAQLQRPWGGPWRIDVLALVLGSNGRIARVNHIISAIEE